MTLTYSLTIYFIIIYCIVRQISFYSEYYVLGCALCCSAIVVTHCLQAMLTGCVCH